VTVATLSAAVDRALAAYALLEDRASVIEDEAQYIADLTAAWRARLETVRAARGAEMLGSDIERAIEAVTEEAGLIADPHRAIDWLSTLPQVVLAAFSEAA
jgi:hypothetical protein